MNAYPLPYFPIGNNPNIIYEINELKERVKRLEEKVNNLDNSEDHNYLKKDDNYYMI